MNKALDLLMDRTVKRLIISLVIALFGACQPTGTISGNQPEAPDIKLPPEGKPGGETSNGCEGVTELGECRLGTAVKCNVSDDSLQQVDCAALGQECVIDPDRGAKCTVLDLPPPGEGPCRGQATAAGSCSAEGAAVWCDVTSNQIYAWTCADSALSCQVDACQSGAYCCPDEGTPPPDPDECETLGFNGECAGMVARWCNNDTLIELDCEAEGKVCGFDQCAVGAFCCVPPEQPNPCPDIGYYGACRTEVDGEGNETTYADWCESDDTYQFRECTDGRSCMLDVCFTGAECCTQQQYDDACEALGTEGRCSGADGNTAIFCLWGDIRRNDCTENGETCQVDTCLDEDGNTQIGGWCC